MATADRVTCDTRVLAPLIDQAVCLLVSSLFNKLVNVIFMSTCVSIKLDSVAHFLVASRASDMLIYNRPYIILAATGDRAYLNLHP